ncbi:MAG: hypothetical protein A3F17_02160 [Gammaproteobacteria bacterium RIFCSPHIGHO2_12_FULL_41_15]|nr:MAG: hypothetical protein A3F17_02160 [Gammaproteobacteria bacterium RIFCSPHIGHO2_12_FULL_41_15]
MLNNGFLTATFASAGNSTYPDPKALFTEDGPFRKALDFFQNSNSPTESCADPEKVGMTAFGTLYEVYLNLNGFPPNGWRHYNQSIDNKLSIPETYKGVCDFMKTALEAFKKTPEGISYFEQMSAAEKRPLSPAFFAGSPRSPDGLQSQVPTPIRFV